MNAPHSESPQAAALRLSAKAITDGFAPEALHTYADIYGNAIYHRIRARHPEGRKWIRPMRRNSCGYELGEPDFENGKPLYRLEQSWCWKTIPVFITEGEKAADALDKFGIAATTSGGADSAEAADWSPLAGGFVIVWPDNDTPGRRYAEAVTKKLTAIGTKVRWVDITDLHLPEKGDAADWVAANPGATPEDVEALPLIDPPVVMNDVGASGNPDDGPEPLPDELLPVEPFDFGLLPASLAPWAEDICERVQCPPDFIGVAIMTALGSAIGRKVAVRPQEQTDWMEYANAWAMLIGRPGVLKSPAMEAALAPLKRLQALEAEKHDRAMQEFERAKQMHKLKTEAAEKAARARLKDRSIADVADLLNVDEPEAPTLRRYIANDTTAEALGELLRQNPDGLLVYRDEIVSLLKTLDREEYAAARGFYLTAWSGSSGYTFDRIGRGLNLHIPAACISMLGSTQPGRIAEYLRTAVKGGAGDDGLIQRFGLMVWPDTALDWKDVDRWPNSEARVRAHKVFEALVEMRPEQVRAVSDEYADTPYLRFHPSGLALFRQWRAAHERKLRSADLHPALESHLAKYRKLVPALALTCHLAEVASVTFGTNQGGSLSPKNGITEGAVLQALAWAEYLESHARRAYASATMPKVSGAKAILHRIRNGDLPAEFTARTIYRNHWALLSDRATVQEALELLADHEWLVEHELETGGRPQTVYVLAKGAQP